MTPLFSLFPKLCLPALNHMLLMEEIIIHFQCFKKVKKKKDKGIDMKRQYAQYGQLFGSREMIRHAQYAL